MRTDLLVMWKKGEQDIQKIVLELKILYKSLEKTINLGLEQTHAYMDRCDCHKGHLVIFNRNRTVSWDEKIFSETREYKGREIVFYKI